MRRSFTKMRTRGAGSPTKAAEASLHAAGQLATDNRPHLFSVLRLARKPGVTGPSRAKKAE